MKQLEQGLNNFFCGKRTQGRKARLQAKETRIRDAANAAYEAGNRHKGRRLDEAAFRTWKAWQFVR